MYQLVRKDGSVLSAKAPVFVKRQPGGLFLACGREEADGVMAGGVRYTLREDSGEGCERVSVVEVGDVPDLTPARNTANIDYLSMMTGVELPQGGM